MQRQHVLQEELVDVLHRLHLLSLRVEATLQQEVHAAAQLVLTGARIRRKKFDSHTHTSCSFFKKKRTHTHRYLSGQYEAYDVKDDQPNSGHDLRVLQHSRPAEKHTSHLNY